MLSVRKRKKLHVLETDASRSEPIYASRVSIQYRSFRFLMHHHHTQPKAMNSVDHSSAPLNLEPLAGVPMLSVRSTRFSLHIT